MGEVSRDTFKNMEEKDKLNVLFDKLESNDIKLGYLAEKLNKKLKIDGACSTIGGFVGGMIAIFTKTLIFK